MCRNFVTVQCYDSAVYDVIICLCICLPVLSVTCLYCIKLGFFCIQVSVDLSYTMFREHLWVCQKLKILPSGLQKSGHGSTSVASNINKPVIDSCWQWQWMLTALGHVHHHCSCCQRPPTYWIYSVSYITMVHWVWGSIARSFGISWYTGYYESLHWLFRRWKCWRSVGKRELVRCT